jgi:GTP cyclohydrolase I
MREKTDSVLGQNIHKHLLNLGLETPMAPTAYTEQEKMDIIEENMANILTTLGLDLNDDSLVDTPRRVGKMFVRELFWGLDYENFPKCTVIDNKMGYDEMVLEKCTVTSACEHHMVYFSRTISS